MTVSTFYPETGSGGGNTTCDGYIRRVTDGAWSEIRNGAGESINTTGTTVQALIQTAATTDIYASYYRATATVDATSIGTDVISDAKWVVVGQTKTNTLAASLALSITGFTPTNYNTLQASDYSEFGNDIFGEISYASFSTGSANDITLNSDGISNINDVCGFMFRLNTDAEDNEPTWAASKLDRMYFYSSDQSGTSQDPYLEVTHEAGGGSTFIPKVSIF